MAVGPALAGSPGSPSFRLAGKRSVEPPRGPAARLGGGVASLWRSFSGLGLVIGALLLAASLTPSLIPRSFLLQGVLGGVCFAIGYGVGILCREIWAWLELPFPSERWARRLTWAAAAVAAVIVLSFLWKATGWQNSIRAAHGHAAGRERAPDRGRGDRGRRLRHPDDAGAALRTDLLARAPLCRPLRARADLEGDRAGGGGGALLHGRRRRARPILPATSPTGPSPRSTP